MKKGFKVTKLISVILVLAMLSTMLVGCIGKADTSSSTGDSSDTVLKLGIVKKGYGDEFLYKLAEAFQEKTGITTIVEKSSSADWVETAMKSGASNNDIDIIFDICSTNLQYVATKGYVTGYDVCYVDISDVYDTVLEGYSFEATLEEVTLPYVLKAVTWGDEDGTYGDGNQYMVNWAAALEGLIYNVDLFEEYGLTIPKTTDEFFALLEQIKTINGGTYAVNEDGYTIYPFSYSGKVDYLYYLANVWMAQYDGETTFFNMLAGQDADGNYTPDSVKTAGKLSALTIVSELLDVESGYSDPNSATTSFTDAQVLFLAEQAFMMSTGDWLEREMEANFESGMNIAFMAIPINSDIINVLDTVNSDEELSAVIAYLDGDTDVCPSYVSEDDLAYIKSARSMYTSEAQGHVAYIPAYSDNIEAAKEFLLFMFSKEGQEIMLEYAYGNMSTLNIDINEFDYASELTPLQLSKFNILTAFDGATLVGQLKAAPMAYGGGIRPFNLPATLENMFGVIKTSDSYWTPLAALEYNYELISGKWESMISTAGVSN